MDCFDIGRWFYTKTRYQFPRRGNCALSRPRSLACSVLEEALGGNLSSVSPEATQIAERQRARAAGASEPRFQKNAAGEHHAREASEKVFFIKPTAGLMVFISWFASTSMARAVNISLGLPGLSAEPKPTEFVAQLYQFAIMISGILALGAIVYGGIKYMTAGGNPSAQGEGKEWIKSALLGLLLLFGAYFILNIVNPDLTKLELPTLTQLPASPAGGSGTGGGGGSGGDGICHPSCSPPQVCSIENGQPKCIAPQVGSSKCNGGSGCGPNACVASGNTFFCQEKATGCIDNHGRAGCSLGQVCVRGLGGPTCATQGDQ